MNFGVLGTGMVGNTIGTKLVSLGHSVKIGSRETVNTAASTQAKSAGKGASQGTFADAAAFGEIVFVCFARGCEPAGAEVCGTLTTARGTEMLMPIWMRLFGLFRTPHFDFRIVK